MTGMLSKIAIVAVAQLALVGVAVAPQLSARAFGDEYRMRVAPVDPIDPFRGAYVDLGYPDLRLDQEPPDRRRRGDCLRHPGGRRRRVEGGQLQP